MNYEDSVSQTAKHEEVSQERISSGIEGLDTILAGGFIPGGITIVQGRPGAGKTILGNQMCFNHARSGRRALYVTLLAESHVRMLMHLSSLTFFDQSAIPDSIYYVSAFSVLESDGLRGLLTLLRRQVQAHEASLLVLDGLVVAEQKAASDTEFKKFIHELQTLASVTDCAMFLLTSPGSDEDEASVEHTMVDCVIDLRSRLYGWRSERDMEVLKRRGASYLQGRHAFAITDAGIAVYPRFEAMLARPANVAWPGGAMIPSGLPQLDVMFGGGIPLNSMTMLEGPPGVGKTALALHFLSPCSEAEPGLLFTTSENPNALIAKARAFGLPTAGLIEAGHIEVIWQPSTEGLLDAAFHNLLETVRRIGARRLCIDSLAGLLQLAPDQSRLPSIFAALEHELRALEVTTLFTAETKDSYGHSGALSLSGIPQGNLSSIADNIVIMRLIEQQSSLVRLISVLKARDAPIDPRLRSFVIGARGISIAETLDVAPAPRRSSRPTRSSQQDA